MPMEHLFPYSVYHEGPAAEVIREFMSSGADGIELLTRYEPVDPVFKGAVKGVHLPYATDWYSSWCGRPDVSCLSEDEIKFVYYGRDRNDIITNLRSAIVHASPLMPEYAVLHGGSVTLDEVFEEKRTFYDNEAIDTLAEMVNSAVSQFSGGKPPFTILFENLWWSGIRLLNGREMKRLDRKLEFDDWGFCLDTGHMMNAVGTKDNEKDAVLSLMEVFADYTEEMKERIVTMHLHQSTSCELPPAPDIRKMNPLEKLSAAYERVGKTDQHRPFTIPECRDLVNEISPAFVTHEIPYINGDLSGVRRQRSFFP